MSDQSQITLQIHYHLLDERTHFVDARVYNECEYHFLNALDTIKEYIGDFSIIVAPVQNGSLISELGISTANSSSEGLFAALIDAFTTRNSRALDVMLKRADVIDRIKNGDYSLEEALAIVGSNKKMQKAVSKFFESAQRDATIASIEATMNNPQTNFYHSSSIERPDFRNQIISEESHKESDEIEGTTIAIISPVLQKGYSKPWYGYYSGNLIKFKVEDTEFLKQVYSNEVKFGSATTIKCRLKIERQITTIDGDPNPKEEPEYFVKEVYEWVDDEHYQTMTKRYKRKKEEEKQLSLPFPDEN